MNNFNLKFQKHLLVLFIPLLQCCDQETKGVQNIHPELKDFCVFKKGTFWVFENTNTNQIDTWNVVHTDNGIYSGNMGNIEKEKMYIKSVGKVDIVFESKTDNVLFMENNGNAVGHTMYFHGSLGDIAGGCGSGQFKYTMADSLNGVCHQKTFKYFISPCNTYFPSQITWERNTGIKQMIYNNGDTLNRIDFKAIQ